MKVKVVSLNTWEGILLDKVIEFLQQENADIILLQEVYGGNPAASKTQFRTFEMLQESLDLAYSYFTPGLGHRREEGTFLIGNAIFSKYPILKGSATFFNAPFNESFEVEPKNNHMYPHSLQYVVLATEVGEVNVFNLHGTWDLNGDNYSEQRRQMSDAIIKAVTGKPHVILGGDTNAKPTNQAMRRVEQHLTSVFGDSLKTTFNVPRKDNPGYATASVDMLFVSNDIQVLNKDVSQVDISDHLPLVAILVL